MKAFAGVLAVLLMLSGASFGQTVPATPTAPVQPAAPTQAPDPAQQTATSPPEAGAAPSAETPAASAAAVPAVAGFPVAPGAKVFIDPMNGFGQILADAIVRKKVPVVVTKDPVQADFVMSGEAHMRDRGFLAGFVLSSKGGANISMKDAHGYLVFACNLHRTDSMERDGDRYWGWADQCAGHLKKAMKQEEKRKASSLPH